MSFGQEMKDFAEGFKTGSDLGEKRATTRLRRAQAKLAEGPNDADLAAQPDAPKGGAKLEAAPSDGSATSAVNIKDDPEAGKVLSFIRTHEAGDNPYNKLQGGKTADLTNMTVGQVLDYQRGMRNRGHESTALGAYQFIQGTLMPLVEEQKIPLDAKFDQAMQDQLGYALLQRRGWGDYKSGKLDKDGLMDNLAAEWASLPLASGKSKYAGVGSNAAGVSRDDFAAAVPDIGAGGGVQVADSGGAIPLPEERPSVTASGKAETRPVFTENTDPASVKGQLNPKLDRVVARAAADNPGLFALNPFTYAGKRTPEQQQEMHDLGYSGIAKGGKHGEGKALDLVPVNPATGKPDPDYREGYSKIESAMRKAAEQEGVPDLKWGGTFKTPDRPHWQVSMLDPNQQAQQQQIRAGGEAPPVDQQAQPTMWAAEGGVLPEPDKYNPGRAFTQQPPSTPPSSATFKARRVGEAPARAATTAGPSQSQLAFRNARAAAAVPAAAPAVAAPAVAGDWQTAMKNQEAAQRLQQMATPSRGIPRNGGSYSADPAFAKQLQDYNAARVAAVRDARAGGTDTWTAMAMVDPNKYAAKLQRPKGFAEGGVIPEPGQAFARGGRVGDPNKERAQAQGDVYRASRDDEYWKVRQPKPRTDRQESSGQRATSVAGARGPDRRKVTGGSPGRSSPSSSPAKKVTGGSPPDERTRNATSPSSLGESLPVATSPSSVTQPLPGSGATSPSSLGTFLPVATSPSSVTGRMPTVVSATEPNSVLPDEGPVSDVGSAMDPGATGVPTGPSPGALPEPLPERFGDPRGPQNPPMVPLNMLRAGNPGVVQAPMEMPPPPGADAQAPEQGAWVNGLWVPANPGVSPGYGFAEGGAVPEEDDEVMTRPISPRAESAAYGSSAPASAATIGPAPTSTPPMASASASDQTEEQPKASLQATPKLMADVSEAVKGGARYLTKVFGLHGNGDGALPTFESGQAREEGIRRFASGEGAATPDEISAVDSKIDPDGELTEGDRQMTRLAKTQQWYLERGEKDKAEAVAASLMQYGAQRFGKLGSMAGAAYKQYLSSKDPADLEATTKYLEKAYEMVPDAANMSVELNPETHQLQATRTGADGKEETYNVKPEELPGLIQQTMNGSAYWKQVFRLGDPQGSQQREAAALEETKNARELREEQAKTADTRTYDEKKKLAEEERAKGTKIEEEKRAAELEEKKKLRDEALLRDRPAKPPAGDVDTGAAGDLLAAASDARGKIDKNDPATLDAYNQAASRLFDVIKDPSQMQKLGFDPNEYTYVQPPAADAAGPAAPKQAPDGKWYIKKPNGKFAEVEAPTS